MDFYNKFSERLVSDLGQARFLKVREHYRICHSTSLSVGITKRNDGLLARGMPSTKGFSPECVQLSSPAVSKHVIVLWNLCKSHKVSRKSSLLLRRHDFSIRTGFLTSAN